MVQIKYASKVYISKLRKQFREADAKFETINQYPSLNTEDCSEVVNFVKALVNTSDTIKVSFGTEGGLFNRQLGIPTVICGPGSMSQGHKADEFVSVEELNKCDTMLSNLLEKLEIGI